jgi:hypothetical protein
MSLLVNRLPRAKARPVSGTVRWLVTIGEADAGALEVNGTAYTINVLRGPGRAIVGSVRCNGWFAGASSLLEPLPKFVQDLLRAWGFTTVFGE